jgi:hypothetical protein
MEGASRKSWTVDADIQIGRATFSCFAVFRNIVARKTKGVDVDQPCDGVIEVAFTFYLRR